MFEGLHAYFKFLDLDPGLTDSWEITPTDSTGMGISTFTTAIAEPEFVPLVKNVAVRGTPLAHRVDWTLPNLAGFDVEAAAVRVFDAATGGHLWQSDTIALQTTSFTAPAGDLQVGVEYVYGILLGDFEGGEVENASWTFSAPFRFTALTTNGDFNLDGTVDAADYVVWRNGLGTTYTQSDYDVWRPTSGKRPAAARRYPPPNRCRPPCLNRRP